MSIFNKLKTLFASSKEAENTENTAPAEDIAPNEEQPAPDEKTLEEARRREEALLDALSALHIVQSNTQTSSFLLMHSYSFEGPFDGRDLRNLVNGMRWLGFRLYSFSVRSEGESIDCESWQQFSRHLAESKLDGVSLLTSFGGVRVNCTIEAEGSVHFSHDSSRGVDFSPFEGLFDPEDIPVEPQ